MKTRVVLPPQGIYSDFRAVSATGKIHDLLSSAKEAGVQILFTAGIDAPKIRNGVLVAPTVPLPHFDEPEHPTFDPKQLRELNARFKQYPDEVFDIAGPLVAADTDPVALRHTSMHILARELTDAPQNLNRAYIARDWLCDPAGFFFIAEDNYGAYDIGDSVPFMKGLRLTVHLPITGTIRIFRDQQMVAEKTDSNLTYSVTEQGTHHAEIFLTLAGEQRPWIRTDPIVVNQPSLIFPNGQMSPSVEVRKDIPYVDDGNAKHKLDLYLPKNKNNFPVMVFYHGGSWKSGDRSLYPLLGNRFAKAGIGVVIPSYRLIPQDPYPAQIEDVAAAFAWVYRNIVELGGDVSRIYVAGHSAGGHLASLLALDPMWLKKYDISPGAIHGVASLSGIYDVSNIPELNEANASPIRYVHPRTPPFLISYCQWDYFGLPKQARDFAEALRKEFNTVRLLYVPGQSHISEIISVLGDDDPLARALIDFVNSNR